MKRTLRIVAIVLLAFAATAAFASETKTASLTLYESVVLAGTRIPPGDYRLTVERDGANAKVSLIKGHTTVVQTAASFTEGGISTQLPVVVTSGETVREIQVPKLKGTLKFDAKQASNDGK